MSQHCWAQHVACVWPPCCNMLGVVGSSLKLVKLEPTCRNKVAKRTQHVAPNNVAICCVVVWPDSTIKSSTNKCDFRYRQSNVQRFLPASDYCRALFCCLNCAQRFDYSALGSSRKLGGVAEHLIDGSENRICRLRF